MVNRVAAYVVFIVENYAVEHQTYVSLVVVVDCMEGMAYSKIMVQKGDDALVDLYERVVIPDIGVTDLQGSDDGQIVCVVINHMVGKLSNVIRSP